MNWKLIFLLSLFGFGMGLGSLTGLGFLLLFLWPIILVISVYAIVTRARGHYFLHGLVTGIMIYAWAGVIHAYYLFDLKRLGLVEVLPHRIHPQMMNAIENIGAGLSMGVVVGIIASLAARVPRIPSQPVDLIR